MKEPTQCICEKPYIAVGTKHCANCGGYPTEDTPNYLKDLADRSNRQRSLNEAEDTPTQHWTYDADCSHEISPTTLHCTKCGHSSKFIMEQSALPPKQDDKQLEIRKLLEEYRIPRHSEDREWVDLFVEKFEALFTTAQLQLVIELMSRSKIYAGLNPTSTEDAVPLSVLEHKKQELERLQ